MKNERGITLTALIIYVMGLVIVIGTLSMFLDYYYSNVKKTTYLNSSAEQYSKLTMYITEDINSKEIKNVVCNSSNYLYFQLNNGEYHQYIYTNDCIYYIERDNSRNVKKQIQISKKVEKCIFSYDKVKNSINVLVNINGTEYNNIYTEVI